MWEWALVLKPAWLQRTLLLGQPLQGGSHWCPWVSMCRPQRMPYFTTWAGIQVAAPPGCLVLDSFHLLIVLVPQLAGLLRPALGDPRSLLDLPLCCSSLLQLVPTIKDPFQGLWEFLM